MSARSATAALQASPSPQSIARVRAVLALIWAAAIAIAAGDTGMELTAGVALLVSAYPLIDVVASLAEAAQGGAAAGRLRANAAISGLAVAGLAIAAFGAEVSTVLAVFGAWAVVSGLIQLANAVQRRRAGTRETPMLLSGGISALAGISFIAASGGEDPKLTMLAGYAAFGAVLFLVWAYRSRRAA